MLPVSLLWFLTGPVTAVALVCCLFESQLLAAGQAPNGVGGRSQCGLVVLARDQYGLLNLARAKTDRWFMANQKGFGGPGKEPGRIGGSWPGTNTDWWLLTQKEDGVLVPRREPRRTDGPCHQPSGIVGSWPGAKTDCWFLAKSQDGTPVHGQPKPDWRFLAQNQDG